MPLNSFKKVRVSELKRLSIQFSCDVYILAVWILVNDLVYSKHTPGCTRRTTIHGLSKNLAYLTRISSDVIESHFTAAGFPAGATIELDDDTPANLLQLIAGN